ncbi:MAG: response regulator [Chloroflexota bacterium]|nr:response regulator [Chloroflexota bacterium]
MNQDSAFLTLLDTLLVEESGYIVSTSADANGAYTFVKDLQPDVAILDMVLQNADRDWRTVELLRQDPATGRIPIILCAADTYAVCQRQKRTDEFRVEILPKPFDIDTLLNMVGQALIPHHAV